MFSILTLSLKIRLSVSLNLIMYLIDSLFDGIWTIVALISSSSCLDSQVTF